MSRDDPMSLEDLIQDSGQGWLIENHASRTEAMGRIRQILAEAQRLANDRGLAPSVALGDDALVAEHLRNPQKLRSLFQAVGAAETPEMLLMAWRVIQGMEFKELLVSYKTEVGGFSMRVVLECPDEGGGDECYESSRVGDFRLLRHIGFFEVGGLPMLEGFYPLRLGAPTRTAR